MTPIDKIKDAASKCQAPELSNIVYLDTDLGLYSLADQNQKTHCFIDVPAKAVVALGRSDFWIKNESWKNVLNHIHGTNWPEEIFEYFSSDLSEKSYPAPYSRGELRLICVGGACEVGNGNHRLVAGKNWLISQEGSDAILKKVKVTYYSLNRDIQHFLRRAAEKNLAVRVSRSLPNQLFEYCIHLSGDCEHQLWGWDGKTLTKLKQYGWLKSLLLRLFQVTPDFCIKWKMPLPSSILMLLIDDEWAAKQLHSI